tara:strand:- start:45 stop:1025 length:981 start_codon:yes stop_codon:yes gene_type:complete
MSYGRWSTAARKSDLDKEWEAISSLQEDVQVAYDKAMEEAESQSFWESIASVLLPALAFMFFPALGSMGVVAGSATYAALSGLGDFVGHSLHDLIEGGVSDQLGIDVASYAPETYASQVRDQISGEGNWEGETGKWVHANRTAEQILRQQTDIEDYLSDLSSYQLDEDFLPTFAESFATKIATAGLAQNYGKYDIPGTQGGEWTVDPNSGNMLLDGQPATPGVVLNSDDFTNAWGGDFTPFQDFADNFKDMFASNQMEKMAYGQGINKFVYTQPFYNAAGDLVKEGTWGMNPLYIDFMKSFQNPQNSLWNQISKYAGANPPGFATK